MVPVPQAGSYRDSMLRAPRLVALAIEPSGEGPYVEAVQEWIEQITPVIGGPGLHLVR
jgi:hypothetical protein